MSTIGQTVPFGAEWVLVTDGPMDVLSGLRPHVLLEGPHTARWGDVQRQVGLEAATRPFVTFLDDDNVMLPMLAELVIPVLEASGQDGAVFGLLLLNPGGFFIWPPPVRIERSQVDTAMFLGRTEVARRVGWPDLSSEKWRALEGQRCGDFVFIRAFDEQARLLRLPMIAGFHDGVGVLRHHAPDLFADLTRGVQVGDRLLALLHGHMGQADAPPWWKGQRAMALADADTHTDADTDTDADTHTDAGSVVPELDRIARWAREGSSVPAQRAHFRAIVRRLAADRPGQAVNVLEVGFNAGLGAAAFLEALPQAHVVSFDLGEHPHVLGAVAHLRSRFPDRLHVVIGDSRETVAVFAAEAGTRFDLILIDGGHDELTCRTDVLNCRAAAAPGAVVIVDDLMPHKPYGVGVVAAWEALLADGVLEDPEIWCARPGASSAEVDTGEPTEHVDRRWGVARYGRCEQTKR